MHKKSLTNMSTLRTVYFRSYVEREACSRRSFVEFLLVIVKFVQDRRKYRKRQARISAYISARLFRATCSQVSGILIGLHKNLTVNVKSCTQYIYCLTCAHLVDFYPTQRAFTPPGEFYPQSYKYQKHDDHCKY